MLMAKISILSESYNKLLHRKDIQMLVDYDGATPKRAELLKLIAEHLKVSEDRIAIIKMESLFGQHRLSVHCHVYDTVEDMKKYEREYVLKRQQEVEASGKTG
jgi:small subunit ribosomal protein S24e